MLFKVTTCQRTLSDTSIYTEGCGLQYVIHMCIGITYIAYQERGIPKEDQ